MGENLLLAPARTEYASDSWSLSWASEVVERLVLGESSATRVRGVKIGLEGVRGDCSREALVEEGRNVERRYWLPAWVSMADGILVPFGLAMPEVWGDDDGMDAGSDWRLVRAMRDCGNYQRMMLGGLL